MRAAAAGRVAHGLALVSDLGGSRRLATMNDVAAIRDQLAATGLVGVDTEFHVERRYLPQLYLVQLFPDRGSAWLFDPLEPTPLLACAEALIARPWIVHGGAHDLRLLQRAIGHVSAVILDTQVGAALLGADYPAPYGALVERFLGRRLPKVATLSDWSRRPLQSEQLAYAADDVEPLPTLWRSITGAVEGADRGDLLRDALAEAREAALSPDPSELWREIPGAVALSAEQVAIVRELAIWRDAFARVEDQPPRAVLPDGILTELARRRPESPDALVADRRMSKSIAKRAGADIIAAIRRGEQSPPALVAARHTAPARAVAFLESVVDVVGHRHGWSPRLVAPRARLEAIVIDPPASRDALRARLGWRDRLAGDAVWDALSGDLALRIGAGDVVLGA